MLQLESVRTRQARRPIRIRVLLLLTLLAFAPPGRGQADRAGQLIDRLKSPDRSVRADAESALIQLGSPAVVPLIAALEDPDPSIRSIAAECLGKIKDARAVSPLITALGDRDRYVEIFAVIALGEIGDVRAVEPLRANMAGNASTQRVATEALAKIEHTGGSTSLQGIARSMANLSTLIEQSSPAVIGPDGFPEMVKSVKVDTVHNQSGDPVSFEGFETFEGAEYYFNTSTLTRIELIDAPSEHSEFMNGVAVTRQQSHMAKMSFRAKVDRTRSSYTASALTVLAMGCTEERFHQIQAAIAEINSLLGAGQ
jgi:hypothetical protein